MKYIRNGSLDPYYNLAFEEYCFENLYPDEDFFIIWRNLPSIIVGSHQNVFEEVNHHLVKDMNIPVVRRISGGGTVYHDPGNVNFSFVFNVNEHFNIDYHRHNQLIIDSLKAMGIDAEMSERNDLTFKGKKISGNAQRIIKRRAIHHGTILYDADLERLDEVIRPSMTKIESKAIQSVRSKVINIKPFINRSVDTVETFSEKMINFLSNNYECEEFTIHEEDLKAISELEKSKYKSWQWNYGESPKFSYQNSLMTQYGVLSIDLNVRKGRIESGYLYGEHLRNEISLKGIEYRLDSIMEVCQFLNEYEVMKLFF
jgi:lipoate-protein ligase A